MNVQEELKNHLREQNKESKLNKGKSAQEVLNAQHQEKFRIFEEIIFGVSDRHNQTVHHLYLGLIQMSNTKNVTPKPFHA